MSCRGLFQGLSLFSGTGALDMAAEAVLDVTPGWFADVDPGASKLLAHHWPHVPNLGDIAAVDWNGFGDVYALTGGWPCQPFSLAGKRKGAEDERALWPEVDRAIRVLRPRYVLLENVPAVVRAGELRRVADSLASCGYRFAWVCLTASSVGAPHRRERLFIAATQNPHGATGGERRVAAPGQASPGWARAHPGGRGGAPPGSDWEAAPTADADGEHEWAIAEGDRPGRPEASAGDSGRAASDTDSAGRPTRGGRSGPGNEGRLQPVVGSWENWGAYTPAIERWASIVGRTAPAPTVAGARSANVLNPALPEWMMGLPGGHITTVPGLTRNQMLKLAGNGVVVQQAIAAYRYLLPLLEQEVAA